MASGEPIDHNASTEDNLQNLETVESFYIPKDSDIPFPSIFNYFTKDGGCSLDHPNIMNFFRTSAKIQVLYVI